MHPSPAAGSSSGRRRPPRACQNCSRRKVSCDKIRPSCSRCVRQKLHCQYAYANTGSDGVVIIDETSSVIAENTAIPSRLQKLGSLIEELVPGQTGLETHSEDETAMAVDQKESYPGHLYNGSQTKSRYLSPSSYALISDEIASINDLLRAQQRNSTSHGEDSAFEPSRRSSSSPFASSTGANGRSLSQYGDIFPRVPTWSLLNYSPQQGSSGSSAKEILAELPSREQCDLLLWAYMVGFHPMMPIIDTSAFLLGVQQLHDSNAGLSDDFNLSTHFVSLFAAVLFAGSVVCPRNRMQQTFGHRARERLSARLYKLTISAIRCSDFPQVPSLQSLAAYLIVDTTWLREEQPLTCCSFVGVAYRVAQILGLHQDPSQYKSISESEIHLRRDLWWTLIAIDAQVALAAGLPPLIPNKAYDVQPVSASLSLDSKNRSPSQPVPRSLVSLFIARKYSFYKSSSEFLQAIHRNVLDENDLDKILQITQHIRTEMDAYKLEISAMQLATQTEQPGSASSENVTSPYFAELAKMVLSMYAAKPYAIMYGPLRRHGLLDSLRRREPNAMMNCRDYLHRFLQLTQRNDFQPWHWCWPGRHQPLHSIMALITDLQESPTPQFVKETRQLIDLALSMCSGDTSSAGVISNEDGEPDTRPLQDPGGNEVWNFIRRARDKCWERAGLDPDELHCPQNVRQIRFQGFAFSENTDEMFQSPPEGDWSHVPFTNEEWAFLNQTTLDLDWELNTHLE